MHAEGSVEAETSSLIAVRIGDGEINVDRFTFTTLFDNSVVATRAPYLAALDQGRIAFKDLVDLACMAQIPYPLFFAPREVVEAQVEEKTEKLLAGISKDAFSMRSRQQVRLRDVELIVKDLLRKQETLKRLDKTLTDNALVGCLTGPPGRGDPVADARTLRQRLDLPSAGLTSSRDRNQALETLVRKLERRQVLVATSQPRYMPQMLPRHVKFSGLCIKDRKIPYIFLTGGEGGANDEPTGRRLFTLALLTVFIARGRFAPVTYDDQTGDLISDIEYQTAEELLIPTLSLTDAHPRGLGDVQALADHFKVTPSAMVMRLRRLGRMTTEEARAYLEELEERFRSRPESHLRPPHAVNAVRRYCGNEFSRRMVRQLDLGRISVGEFCRVVTLKKLGPADLPDFIARIPA